MAMMERPLVRETAGGKCWEHEFEQFFLKVFVPDNEIDGQVNNYGFRAPCLLVFEEEKQEMEQAVSFAKESGLAPGGDRRERGLQRAVCVSEGGGRLGRRG